MPRRRFAPEEEREIVRRYLAGESSPAIAASLGATPPGIRGVLNRHGVEARAQAITDEQEALVVKLCRGGASIAEAGEEAGLSASSVGRVLRKYKIGLAKGPARKFTAEEEGEMWRCYEAGESMKAIADKLGCGTMTVQRTVKRLGKEARYNGRSLTEDEQLIAVDLAIEGETLVEIARRLDVDAQQVARIVSAAGVEMRKGRPPVHELNHAAFDALTPECAYWIGFLVADGCLHRDHHGAARIIVALQARDRGHVEKFRAFMGSTHIISDTPARPDGPHIKSGPGVRISVRSNRIGEMLTARGMVSGKPDRVPCAELDDSPDFWRGMVDGDGSVGTGNNRYGYADISLCGQLKVVERFAAFMKRRVGAQVTPTKTQSGIWHVQTSGSTALAALELLYRNAIVALDRKCERAMAHLFPLPHRHLSANKKDNDTP